MFAVSLFSISCRYVRKKEGVVYFVLLYLECILYRQKLQTFVSNCLGRIFNIKCRKWGNLKTKQDKSQSVYTLQLETRNGLDTYWENRSAMEPSREARAVTFCLLQWEANNLIQTCRLVCLWDEGYTWTSRRKIVSLF